MPVRSDDRSWRARSACVEHRAEHRRHAVQRRAAIPGDRAQRLAGVEALAREHHRRARGRRAQHAEDHAEAVVERHRDAEPVVRAERHRLGAVARVVDDVEVRQRRPFGEPVVPLVNWMLIASSGSSARAQGVEARPLCRPGEREQLPVREAARRHRLVAEQDDVLELGQANAVEHLARALEMDLGRDLAEHAEVVAALAAARHDERAAADLVERVLELGLAIRRIDVDEDEADPRRRELGDDPLVPVRRPDADPVAAAQAEREQTRGHLVGALLQVVPRQAQVLGVEDRRVARAVAGDGLVELLRQGDEAQRLVGRARDV